MMQEADTEYYEGYRIEVEWDSPAQRFVASARRESVRSEHATGTTDIAAIEAVKEKIRRALRSGS
jgi:hypothetical protein